MADGRLGGFVLQHRYRIAAGETDRFLGLIAVVRAWLLEMGAAHFECWRGEADPQLITEVQGYDSWSHYLRLNERALPAKIKEVYHDLGELIEGGFDAVQTQTWEPLEVPRWDGD